MNPEQFRDLRQAAGLSLSELASALRMEGRNAATRLREMESGARPIPGPTGVAMECLSALHHPAVKAFLTLADDIAGSICQARAEYATSHAEESAYDAEEKAVDDIVSHIRSFL